MEAKDTILTDKQMLELVSRIPSNIKPDKAVTIFLQSECKAIAETQAEISFKAGIKEVIPYAEKFLALARHGDTTDGELYAVYKEQWQSKLKEWGIC